MQAGSGRRLTSARLRRGPESSDWNTAEANVRVQCVAYNNKYDVIKCKGTDTAMSGSIIECNVKHTNLLLIFSLAAFVLSAPVHAQTTAGTIAEKEKSAPSSVPLVLEYNGRGRPRKKVPLQFPIEFDDRLFGWFLKRWAEKGYDMKHLLMKIPPPGTELEYDPSTYATYYRFRKELQSFGLQMPNPNAENAGHFHLLSKELPSDPDFRIREQSLKRSLYYNTPEEQNKRLQRRLEAATRKRDIAIIKQAALQEIRRVESSAATQAEGSQKR